MPKMCGRDGFRYLDYVRSLFCSAVSWEQDQNGNIDWSACKWSDPHNAGQNGKKTSQSQIEANLLIVIQNCINKGIVPKMYIKEVYAIKEYLSNGKKQSNIQMVKHEQNLRKKAKMLENALAEINDLTKADQHEVCSRINITQHKIIIGELHKQSTTEVIKEISKSPQECNLINESSMQINCHECPKEEDNHCSGEDSKNNSTTNSPISTREDLLSESPDWELNILNSLDFIQTAMITSSSDSDSESSNESYEELSKNLPSDVSFEEVTKDIGISPQECDEMMDTQMSTEEEWLLNFLETSIISSSSDCNNTSFSSRWPLKRKSCDEDFPISKKSCSL